MADTTTRNIGHLLRRAGFGATPLELDEYSSLGFASAVERLVAALETPPLLVPPADLLYLPGGLQSFWLEQMRASTSPLVEKLALFWHGHFATSIRKVEDPALMWKQVDTFRRLGGGRFVTLVGAVSRDAAMIRWLDGNSNRAGAPNENYARELMELFTLGRGNYTERDVREAARAFTGWGTQRGEFVTRREFHDAGQKTVLGQEGTHDGDAIVNIVTSNAACAPFICKKLLGYFSHPDPTRSEIAAATRVFQSTGGHIGSVLRHLFLAPEFRSEASYRGLVKSPIELVVSAARALGAAALPSSTVKATSRMGQLLFAPPTVKGWDGGRAWLGAGALLERIRFTRELALTAVSSTPEADALRAAFDGPAPATIASVISSATGRERLALALASPEFQLN